MYKYFYAIAFVLLSIGVQASDQCISSEQLRINICATSTSDLCEDTTELAKQSCIEPIEREAAIKWVRGNFEIVLFGYEDLLSFEEYNCFVKNDVFSKLYRARKDSDGVYKCNTYGLLQYGEIYTVTISHSRWPSDNGIDSDVYILRAGKRL